MSRLVAGSASSTYALKTSAALLGISVGSIVGAAEEMVRTLSLAMPKCFNARRTLALGLRGLTASQSLAEYVMPGGRLTSMYVFDVGSMPCSVLTSLTRTSQKPRLATNDCGAVTLTCNVVSSGSTVSAPVSVLYLSRIAGQNTKSSYAVKSETTRSCDTSLVPNAASLVPPRASSTPSRCLGILCRVLAQSRWPQPYTA